MTHVPLDIDDTVLAYFKANKQKIKEQLVAQGVVSGKKEFVFDLAEVASFNQELGTWMYENVQAARSAYFTYLREVPKEVGFPPDCAKAVVVRGEGLPKLVYADTVGFSADCPECKGNKVGRTRARLTVEVWNLKDELAYVRFYAEDMYSHPQEKQKVFRPGGATREALFDYLTSLDVHLIPRVLEKVGKYFIEAPPKSGDQKFSEEALQKARELSADPELLRRIGEDMERNHIGDEAAKTLVLVLLLSSRLQGMEQSVIIKKTSSAGGSNLANTTTSYFDNVIRYSRVTAAAADRSGMDFTGKILMVEEMSGLQTAENSLRVMLSEGSLTLWTTEKDADGNIRTTEIKTKGTPTFITTTPDFGVEGQFANRVWQISLDETEAQTRRVVERQFGKYDWDDHKFEPDPVVKCLLSKESGILDDSLGVKIPYWEHLAKIFPADTIAARRDSRKFATLIALNAWLHQHQRPIVVNGEARAVLATMEDLRQVSGYAKKAIMGTLTKLDDRMVKALEILIERVKDIPEGLTFAAFAKELGTGDTYARTLVVALDDAGFVTIDRSERAYKVLPSGKPLKGEVGDISFTEPDAIAWLQRGVPDMAAFEVGRLSLWVCSGADPGVTALALHCQGGAIISHERVRDGSSHNLAQNPSFWWFPQDDFKNHLLENAKNMLVARDRGSHETLSRATHTNSHKEEPASRARPSDVDVKTGTIVEAPIS